MRWDRAIVEQRCQYNIYFNSPSWNWCRISNGQAASTPSLSVTSKVMIKQSWHYMFLGYKTAPIIRQGWFRLWFRSTFWGLLTFVVSQYAWHVISILLWCCHHPPQLINLQVSLICFFLVHLILGLSASSLVTLQLQLMCRLWKPFPPRKPHILLVVLLCITYDHTHLEVDLHPAKTMQCNAMHLEIIVLVRIFECRIQTLRAFVVTPIQAMQGKIITIWLLIGLRLFKITHLMIR